MVDEQRAYKWIVLFITSIGAMMAPLDGSIVSVSLPVIANSLKMDYAIIIWIPTAYLVTLAVLLLIMGRISDMKGRKKIFVSGFAIFVLGSLLCSLAQSGAELILFRIIQGAGGAFISATSTAIVTDVFPSYERGRALGINIMAVYIGGALGPTLGGTLTYTLGWRSIFWVNIPIGLSVIVLSLWKLKESSPRKSSEPFDVAGMIAFSIGFISLLITMTIGESMGWSSPPILSLLLVALISFLSFIKIEMSKGSKAMFDLSLIVRNRLFAAANAAALLNYTAYYAYSFIMSFYLQRVLGLSTLQTGAVLLTTPITMAILAPISGWASDRIGSRVLATSGMLIIATGLLLLSSLTMTSSITTVTIGLLLLGSGMGLFSSPNTNAIMGCVEKRQLGIASGMVATMRTTGMSLSLAVTGAVMSTVASSQLMTSLFVGANPSQIAVESAVFVRGMNFAFVVCAIIAIIGAMFSFARGPTRLSFRKST